MNDTSSQPRPNNGFWKRNLDKIGLGGSLFAALCCLGLPALLSILSAIGLSFLINDGVLLPLLIVFLLVTLVGLYFGVSPSRFMAGVRCRIGKRRWRSYFHLGRIQPSFCRHRNWRPDRI
jgi:MerC mercury resistance protein